MTPVSNHRHLSFASLVVIQNALDDRSRSLTELHWKVVAFGATDPLYRNIALEQAKLDKARSDLAAIYEAQFNPAPASNAYRVAAQQDAL